MVQQDNVLPVSEMLESLLKRDFVKFSRKYLREKYLKKLADYAREEDKLDQACSFLLKGLSHQHNRCFDWNCGSFIRHAPLEVVTSNIPLKGTARSALYESIGLTWCLGELGRRDHIVIDFLKDAVAEAKNSESWWRSAYSLEKLGQVDAISYLKTHIRSKGLKNLHNCLRDFSDQRNLVGILMHSKLENLHNYILPKAKAILCSQNSKLFEIIGASWIIGHFRYIDSEVETAIHSLLNHKNYEVRFYGLQTIREIESIYFIQDLKELLNDEDPLIRKMAAQGLGRLDDSKAVAALRERLNREEIPEVISVITRGIYDLTHYAHRHSMFIRRTIGANENGMISDEADKWYINPDIYHTFSECQDSENLCCQLALDCLKDRDIIRPENPVDIGSGTGRLTWFLLNNLTFDGVLHCVDSSQDMCKYLTKRAKREGIPLKRIKIHRGYIENLHTIIGNNSTDLIMALFAFPSSIFDSQRCLRELEAIYRSLRPNGYLITIGWDETFNDDLSEWWYKYVPDNIMARDFEEWRIKRSRKIKSARNCELTWFKKGLVVPLEYTSIDVATKVMGYLFPHSTLKCNKRSSDF